MFTIASYFLKVIIPYMALSYGSDRIGVTRDCLKSTVLIYCLFLELVAEFLVVKVTCSDICFCADG